jgi:hypothetical protein
MTEKIIFVAIIVAGLAGFIVALRAWFKSEKSKGLPAWEKAAL